MKTTVLKISLCLVVSLLNLKPSQAQCTGVVYIPDANLKNALLNSPSINTNHDDEIQCTEAENNTGTLSLTNENINDATGIEAFVNLKKLDLSFNFQLANIDVSTITGLTELKCRNNSLTSIDVSNNTLLTVLHLSFNSLTSLDVSNNTALTELWCGGNSFTNIDVSNNTAIETLLIGSGQLESLDVSNNSVLTLLNCSEHALTSLNLANGNNKNMSGLLLNDNPDLRCIQVDDENDNETHDKWTKDDEAIYSNDCDECVVYIPDDYLKFALLTNFAVNTNVDTKIQCSEAENYDGILDLNGINMGDATGLEAFVNVTELWGNNNSLTSIDLSYNTALTKLLISNNQLMSLDVSNNTALTELYCGSNSLTNIDVSNNTALTGLGCGSNSLTSLDLSFNTEMTKLFCGGNSLTSLNIANGNNKSMSDVFTQNNPDLYCVQVDDETDSETHANWEASQQVTFKNNCLNSMQERDQLADLQLYPNPTTNEVRIKISENSLVIFYDIAGKKVLEERLAKGTNTLNLDLQSGIYFVAIPNATTQRLIIE